MKKALPRLSLLFVALLCSFYSHGQSQVFWLTITDSTAIDHIDTIGTSYIPTFTDPGVNGTFGGGGGNVSIEQAMPMADFLCLRQIWRVKGADSAFMNTLVSSYPALFPSYAFMPQFEPLSYTPNDWNLLGQGGVDYLNFIGARDAWDDSLGGTKGDSTVIIGIVDNFFDTTNADIRENSVAINTGHQSGSHGTEVAGVAAGRTDNNHMLPSMGFRCKMNLSDDSDYYSELIRIAKDTAGGRVRVTNGSWRMIDGATTTLKIDGYYQPVFDQLYEDGITSVFGAGNGWLNQGPSQLSYTYEYPASYDFNISVSSIGHRFTSGSSELQDIHEFYSAGDSVHTFQHNDRVDICAPGWGILVQTNGDNSRSNAGTSFSSPTVAGVCALMYSQQSCLTPYQVEYLLKKHSKDIYQQTWDGVHFYNAHYYNGVSRYTSRLGAGRVQADSAVFAAHPTKFECNDPATQTMTIDGVTLTHNCAPNTVTGMAYPQFKIGEIHNGRPPYRYLWTPLEDNNMILSSYTSASPQITDITMRAALNGDIPVASFRLAVYDASEIQKVATVRFKAVLINDPAASDLAMRDSYFDMLDEPNSQYSVNTKNYDIWHSPDLWNRDTLDGGMTHQNPEHFTTDSPNYIYVRVRNVGCASVEQDRAKLKLYWTLSSTGEHWKNDWDGSTLVLGDSAGKWVPGGGLISDTIQIPHLDPGDSFTVAVPWHPTDPHTLSGSPQNADACILARIIEFTRSDSGLHTPEVARTATNVNENNNIATVNLNIVNLGRACANCRTMGSGGETHRVYIASAENQDQEFTVDMVSQKSLQPYLSGDISKYCYITLALDSLYDRWQEGGGKGSYMSKNPETKTVTYDPSSPLRLEGINLHPGEHFPVDVTFVPRSGVTIPFDVSDFKVAIRQIIHEGKKSWVYGAVVYSINIAATDTPQQRRAPQVGNTSPEQSSVGQYEVYPNPVSGLLNVRYTGATKTQASITLTDVSGKTVFHEEAVEMSSGSLYQFKTSFLLPGVYLISIDDKNGQSETRKIVKEK